MELSDKLPHFPALDPLSTHPKDRERRTVATQVSEYLASGGTIKQCTSADNKPYNPHRTRKQVIRDEKRKMIGMNRFKK